MPTVTIRLDEETDSQLKNRLAQSGETLSDFVREAVKKHLESKSRFEPRLASLEKVLERIGDSGETDLSTTYKSRIRKRLGARHRR